MQRISDSGSERATNDSGKVVTHDGRTYVAWQDVTCQGYFNRVRVHDRRTGEWSAPITVGQGVDNHARGVLNVDADGFVHVVLGGHGSAVTWRRTQRPGDIRSWTDPQPLGVGTYPIFVGAPDGTLLLTLRGAGADRADRGVDLYRLPAGGAWEPARRILQLAPEYGQDYAAYHNQLAVGSDGTVHGLFDVYEGADEHGRGLHQATCYARSGDGGRTWEGAEGVAAPPRARPEHLTILARSVGARHEPLPPPETRQGGIVTTPEGDPVWFRLHHTEAAGRVYLGTVAGATVSERIISGDWERRWPGMRATGCWASARVDGALFALVLLTPFDEQWHDRRLPTRAMGMGSRDDERLIWWSSEDGGQTGRVEPCHGPGAPINCPSVERPLGQTTIAADRRPGVLFFDGTNAYPGGGDYYADGRSVAEILASGAAPTNTVWLLQASL